MLNFPLEWEVMKTFLEKLGINKLVIIFQAWKKAVEEGMKRVREEIPRIENSLSNTEAWSTMVLLGNWKNHLLMI
jgi:hypothetical protein